MSRLAYQTPHNSSTGHDHGEERGRTGSRSNTTRSAPHDASPVLLISGLGTQMTRWAAPFCETLAARGFRVIRFDNRDVGLSTHLTGRPRRSPATSSRL